ncbi:MULTISPECIES: ABC transporter ATP-binding protein [unclassified Leucobacter]|uniref:ABC transporter ATP-binding protein n=1 Tax=unclassified Leucobacter TaxID=2621730 RepID=UPI000620FBCC|nr:ATP-binding cassette domain-containing protein [Leucobacter sp. Ag1]KKI20428.1 hypothetical protein XM48_07900 [Leucobacter sp. Ag1]
MTAALIEAEGLVTRFRTPPRRLFERAGSVAAIDGIDLRIEAGESVAIVGESGSGKSTLLRALLGLGHLDAGTVRFDGRPVVADPRDRMLWLRRRTGLVFQDPYASFNPRRTIGQTVAEPLEAIGETADAAARVDAILDRLGLPADAAQRLPREFSGGQRQRIAIARALVHGPELLVGDEPVSALDVLVRRRILELLAELRRDLGLTMLTVTHDLAIVPTIAERVVVMRRGRIVESGPVARILEDPREPYTRELVASRPTLPPGTWIGR